MLPTRYTGPPFKIDHTNNDHTKEVWCARFSPDGTKLASVGADRKIVFYDPKEGTKISEIAEGVDDGAHSASIISCCWSPDSTKLATCSLDKTVKVWDASSNKLETTFTFGESPTVGDMQCAVAWFGPHLVSLNLAGELNYLDVTQAAAAAAAGSNNTVAGPHARTVVAHSGPIASLCTLADERGEFLSGGGDGLVLKWDASFSAQKAHGPDKAMRGTHGGKVVGVFANGGGGGGAGAAAESGGDGGGPITSVGFDDKVRFTDSASMVCSGEVALDGQPACVCSSTSSGLVVVATSASTLHFFKDGAALLTEPLKLPGVPSCAALNHDETELALGGVGGANTILVFGLDVSAGTITAAPKQTVEGHRGAVGCLAYSPDGLFLAAGDANREVKVWDRSTWTTKVSGKWVFHTSSVTCLAWSADSAFVTSGSFDQSVFVWCLATPMKKVQIKFAHKMGVSAVAYLNPSTLVTGGNDGTIALWKI